MAAPQATRDTITIATAEGRRQGELRVYGQVSSDLRVLEKALRKIRGEDGELHVVYEAGPTGFVIHRRLTQLKIDCIVVAPSKLPTEKSLRQNAAREREDGRASGAARSKAEGEEGRVPAAAGGLTSKPTGVTRSNWPGCTGLES